MSSGAKINLIIGQRDSGKTVYLRGDETLKVEGFFKMYLDGGYKILIVDTVDHPKYRDIPIIDPENLPYWAKGIYRIILQSDDMPLLYQVLLEYRNLDNTLVVWEDAYKHCQVKVHKTLKSFLIDAKNRNIENVFMYHAWGWVPNDLYKMIEHIQVFKTLDSPKSKKNEMPGYYEIALETYQQVKQHPVSWHSEFIDTGL